MNGPTGSESTIDITSIARSDPTGYLPVYVVGATGMPENVIVDPCVCSWPITEITNN